MKKILLSLNIIVAATVFGQTPRLSLFEEFTGENCAPCAAVNPNINATMATPINTKRVVPIKWQVPIPSAPTATWSLYQTNKTEINWRFRSVANGGYGYLNGAGISSAPYMLFDGWMQGSGTSADCAAAQSYTSAFSITMNRTWDATQSSVNLTVSIQATANFTATGNLVFRTVMVERIIQFTMAPGSNGETEFHDVAIKSFPTLQTGVAMAGNWVTGQTQTFTLNCPLPSYTRKKEEVAFVGFIQDDGNRKVAQAVRAEKQSLYANDAKMVSLSCTPTMVCNNASVSPLIVMRNNGINTITAFTVTPYLDAVAQTPFTWFGTLTNGAYQTVSLPSFIPAFDGGHIYSCKITGVSGGDPDSLNNVASSSFYVGSGASNLQVSEGFAGAFPPVKWSTVNPDEGITWTKSTAAGGFNLSNESAYYNGYANDRGDVDELILPPLNLSGTAIPIMKFDVAYARRYYRSDTLEVLTSSDCGNTWTLVYQKQDSVLSTIPYAALGSNFTPAANEWRTETVSLPGFNQPNVLVKFRVKNDAGNNIYLDNVNVTQSQPANVGLNLRTLENTDILLYPNPTNGLVYAGVNITQPSQCTLTLLNVTGQIVTIKKTNLIVGTNTVEIDLKTFPSGFYNLVIETNNQTIVKKFSLVK